MLLKLHLDNGDPALVNTSTVTEIRRHIHYGVELASIIKFSGGSSTSVRETLEEIYAQWEGD